MIDVSGLEDLARRCEAARADLKPYAGKFLEEVGEEFLKIVVENIEKAGNVDYGLLKASFTKGRPANIFDLDLGALTLTVGTRVQYADYVNKGHPQQPGRFVPGVFEGDMFSGKARFRYVPGAKTGIILKASYVEGSHYFDDAVDALQKMMPAMERSSFDQFFRRYFP